MTDAFHGSVAAVTGAASGIGRALAEELARRGARVAVADIDERGAGEVVGRIGAQARAFSVDVTDADAVERFVESAEERLGPIDYFFNNAGIAVAGEAQNIPVRDWKRVLAVNLLGVVHGTLAVYPRMIARRRGHIVNIASVAGLSPFPLAIPYTASKHGVVGLSHALRVEAEGYGVCVSVACPGAIDTPIWTRSELRGLDRERLRGLLRRPMSAERCAAILLAGVLRRDATIVVTAEARAMWMIERLSPALGRFLHGRLVRRVRAMVATRTSEPDVEEDRDGND